MMPQSKEQDQKLGTEITNALLAWVNMLMKENTGPGVDVVVMSNNVRWKLDVSYDMTDFFEAINRAAPDAIARMLQAGAAAFIREDECIE
jgi:hypothetical protein